jgi:hypothetical protein
MTTKEALYRIIDALRDDEAECLLQTLGDPVSRALALAPEDDEPLTAEQLAAVEQAREAYRRGEWVSDEEVRREFGW